MAEAVAVTKKMTKAEIRELNRQRELLTRLAVAAGKARMREPKRLERLLIKEVRAAKLNTTKLLLLRAEVYRLAVEESESRKPS